MLLCAVTVQYHDKYLLFRLKLPEYRGTRILFQINHRIEC